MARKTSSSDTNESRLLIAFGLILIVVFSLVFFTGDRKPEPKLGIDLQGGTTVTLQAITPDGQPPRTEQMEQARDILNKRVNGLGVSGSEVKINGSNLVITVPGTNGDQARTLGQTAQLKVRPVLGSQPANQVNTPAPDMTDPESAKKAIADARATRQSTDPAVQKKAADALNCSAPSDPWPVTTSPTSPWSPATGRRRASPARAARCTRWAPRSSTVSRSRTRRPGCRRIRCSTW
ncbi:hypothetical protein MTP03_21510 [Tsukamurella sp. PLM1]|nr:hypothetical protein MTP03_21510 [Tsukamurella sp. PLM1]